MNVRHLIQNIIPGDLMLSTIGELAAAELFLLNRSGMEFAVEAKLYTQENDERKWVEVKIYIPIKDTGINLFSLTPFINKSCVLAFAGGFTFTKNYFYSYGESTDTVS